MSRDLLRFVVRKQMLEFRDLLLESRDLLNKRLNSILYSSFDLKQTSEADTTSEDGSIARPTDDADVEAAEGVDDLEGRFLFSPSMNFCTF